MHRQKTGARAEYRQQETQRIKDSASLADKLPRLKSLTVHLTYYDPKGVTRSSQIKYKVNLTNAKSGLRFDCLNNSCIRGDFVLTEDLAIATASLRDSGVADACWQ